MRDKDSMQQLRATLALLPPVFALILQSAFWSSIHPYVWFLFYPAVFFSSWIGGLPSGLIATVISTMLVWWFFIPPEHSFAIENPVSVLSMAVFVGMGVLFSIFHGRLRKASHQATEALAIASSANERLETRVLERTTELATANAVLQQQIEDRKRTEDQLLLQKIALEAAANAIIITDTNGTIRWANPSFAVLTGYNIEEAIGKNPRMLQSGTQDKAFYKVLWDTVLDGRVWRGEIVNKKKNGDLYTEDMTITPVHDIDGKIISLIAIKQDISERKRAEEKIRNAESRYRSTLDYMLEGCQIIDFDFRYVYLNDVAAEQGHFPKERLLGRTMMEMYPGIDQTPFFEKLRDCMELRAHHRMENEFTYPDGSEGWFYLNIEPVPEGTFILSVDFTQQKKLDEELKKHQEHLEELVKERTAQIEATNDELEAFSYSVSHDLRAPLRHIDGFADLLQKHAEKTLDEEGRRLLRTISDSAKQMGTLIDDLLVFSRMGRVEMQTVKVDMREMVRGLIDRMSQETQRRSIKWTIDDLPEVEGDASMLSLVFQNLLDNAVKYTRPRDEAEIEVGCVNNGKECEFFVRDNGVGFDMQFADKLFGVFQRLHRLDEFEGTGIGLANVRRIVTRHGGKTWAEAAVNQGATIHFSLPKSREDRV